MNNYIWYLKMIIIIQICKKIEFSTKYLKELSPTIKIFVKISKLFINWKNSKKTDKTMYLILIKQIFIEKNIKKFSFVENSILYKKWP